MSKSEWPQPWAQELEGDSPHLRAEAKLGRYRVWKWTGRGLIIIFRPRDTQGFCQAHSKARPRRNRNQVSWLLSWAAWLQTGPRGLLWGPRSLRGPVWVRLE